MCYTAGPRCSSYAVKKLTDAKEAFNQVDPTDVEKMDEAKQALFVAQEEYLTSPAGIKKLQDKAKSTGDMKYSKQAKEYSDKRKQQIAASKALVAEQKEALAVAEKKAAAKTALENSPVPDAAKRYAEETKKLQNEFSALEKFKVPDELVTKKINAETDNDGTQCGYDGECNAYPNDYCRDSEYVNLRVDESSIDTRGTLADIYNCDENDIPDELVKIGRDELDLDNAESYVAESEYGYYGVEGSNVTLSSPFKVQERLKEYYDGEYKKLKEREAELEKSVPQTVSKVSPSAGKQTKATKAPARRGVAVPKKGAPKATTTVAPKRRERTDAELTAFEQDAMPNPADRKPVTPKAPAKPRKPRRERTDAELTAFEMDAMPDTSYRRRATPKTPAKPAKPRRERNSAELDAFEADERN